jgi:ABC-type phosphate transport system auxiliary subunit
LEKQKELEARSTRINELKLDTKWREEMRKTKCVSLQNALALLQTLHERHYSHVEAQVSHINTDLAEAEEQHRLAFAGHMENVDRLVAVQLQRLQELERRFESGVSGLQGEFDEERFYFYWSYSIALRYSQ